MAIEAHIRAHKTRDEREREHGVIKWVVESVVGWK